MSKFAQVYAKSLDVELGDAPDVPSIFEPTPNKYICLSTSTGQPAKVYDYWSEVVFLISPVLSKYGYQIVQIGTKQDPVLPGVVDKRGIPLRNTFHVIRNAKLSMSGDTFNVHLAGMYKVPIVAVYGSTNPKSVGPYWHGKCELIEPEEGLPSYRVDERPKRINTIKPEIIAQKCLDILEINENIHIETTLIGANYNFNTPQNDIIPDNISVNVGKIPNITIRLDVLNNESNAARILSQTTAAIVSNNSVTDKFLTAFKERIVHFTYILEDDYSKDFIKMLHTSGISYNLLLKNKERLNDVKLDINFDFNPVHLYRFPKVEATRGQLFKTTKHFISNGKSYSSLYHYRLGIPFQNQPERIGDALNDPDWLESSDFYYIFTSI